MKRSHLLAGAGSGVFITVGVAAGGVPATSGCTTHQCDSDMVCIDSTGLMKSITNASECTPVIDPPVTRSDGAADAAVPASFYNLEVGHIVSDTGDEALVWDTSSFLGPWLDFPGQRTYVIQFPPGLSGHVPTSVVGWVSSDNDASFGASHANSTLATGQLLEITNMASTQLSVFNDTCVDYGLRIEIVADVLKATDGAVSPSALPDAATVSSDAEDAGATE